MQLREARNKTGPKLKFPPHNFETQVTISVRIVVSIEKGDTREKDREREGEREGKKKRARAATYKIFSVFMPVGDPPGARNQPFHIDTLSPYRFIGRTCPGLARARRFRFAGMKNVPFINIATLEHARHVGIRGPIAPRACARAKWDSFSGAKSEKSVPRAKRKRAERNYYFSRLRNARVS